MNVTFPERMSSNNGSNHNGFCIGSFSTENDIDFWLKNRCWFEWSCYREIPFSPCKKTTFPSNSMLMCIILDKYCTYVRMYGYLCLWVTLLEYFTLECTTDTVPIPTLVLMYRKVRCTSVQLRGWTGTYVDCWTIETGSLQ